MHSNSNESCGNFYKNTNAQPVQINATTEERFFRSKVEIT